MSTYGFFILVYISIGYPSVSRGGVPLDDLVRGHSGTPPGQRERGETWVWLPGSQTRLVPISVSHLCQQSCPQVSVRYGVWGVVCGVVSSVSWGIVKRYCGPFYMECIHALKFCLILFILNCLLSLLKLEAICCSWYSVVCLCVTTLSCYLPPRTTHSLKDNENGNLAPAMNGVVVHSKMVDNFQELLIEQTDLSFMW